MLNVVGSPIETPLGRVGLGICYDLRFPQFSTILRNKGMQIMTYPSAFTVNTGQAHWEVMLRARAIETQSYVVASAQVGQHTSTRASYGNAMVL
jgi:deaminated glutathione amidase